MILSSNAPCGRYPATRLRRTRRDAWSRDIVREHGLSPADLIWPLFVMDAGTYPKTITTLPDIERVSLDDLPAVIDAATRCGLRAVAVFPCVPDGRKTADAREALNPDNVACRAIRVIKQHCPDIGVICDVALDPFNSLGHDGLVRDSQVLNDETVELLCRQAVVQAAAGCDLVAPSDMMDGRIARMRAALDGNGFIHTGIMAYAAKFASAFYGPFREAVGSGSRLKGDKRSYQLDPANIREALREVALDIDEGADMVIVKPGLPYLDVLHQVVEAFHVPTFGYHVSGEYAMLKLAAAAGAVDYEACLIESLLAFKRSGATGVLTYAALDAARILNRQDEG